MDSPLSRITMEENITKQKEKGAKAYIIKDDQSHSGATLPKVNT